MAFNLTQTEEPKRIARLKLDAILAFPNDNPQDAFFKYINENREHNVFFLDENGRRCVWRDTADYSIKWTLGQRLQTVMGSRGRQFKVPVKKRTMADVNRSKAWKIRELVNHPSAGGWNLPTSHKRHFLKFPQELRDLIFGFALTAPKSASVKPLVVSSNWVTEPSKPGFVIEHESYSSLPEQDSLYHTISRVQREDKDGSYTEICFVFRLPIDASFLRACKDFYSIGNAMLYSENEFSFDMVNPYHHKSPPTMLGTSKDHEEWQPDPRKPILSPGRVWKALYDIERHVPIKGLTAWVYYDHFLRWLYSIGPKNAALVKFLKFQGMAKLHHCQMDEDESEFPCFNKPCDDSIIDALRIYIPFIGKFCTGLEKLTLIVEKDNWAKKNPQDLLDDGFPVDREAALRPILEKEIPQIDSLKELVVFGSRHDTEQLDYAKPVAELLRKRALERESMKNQKDKDWAEAKPFVSAIAAARKTECPKKQHLKLIADLQVGGMEQVQLREDVKRIAPVIAAAGKTELCRRFRSVLDLRFGNAEKVEVLHSYFLRHKQ